MSQFENDYLALTEEVYHEGEIREDRTGVGTRSLFAKHLSIDLSEGFPLLTTKWVNFHAVKAELAWFLSGSSKVVDLHAMNCHIWDEWADENGSLGPIYGPQWRDWFGDQIRELRDSIRGNPTSRRHIVSAWNREDLPQMQLAPCHPFWQVYVHRPGTDTSTLSLHLYQRSADIFLGLPFNIASYALLLHILAKETGMGVETLTISLGDVHLYLNHVKQASTQLDRSPKVLPRLLFGRKVTVDNFHLDDAALTGYFPDPAIRAPVAV